MICSCKAPEKGLFTQMGGIDKMLTDIQLKLKTLEDDGIVVIPRFCENNLLKSIKNDVEQAFSSMPTCIDYNDHIFHKSLYRFEIKSLAAVSLTATRCLLNTEIISFIEQYLGGEVALAEFELRQTLNLAPDTNSYLDGNLLTTHSDLSIRNENRGRNGVYAFLMLTDVTENDGPTFLFTGSHHLKGSEMELGGDDFIRYSDFCRHSKKLSFLSTESLSAGDLLLYDLDVWHGRFPARRPGRTMVLAKFYRTDSTYRFENLLVSNGVLSGLTSKQQKTLIGKSSIFERSSRTPERLQGQRTKVPQVDNFLDLINLVLIKFKLIKADLKNILLSFFNRGKTILKDNDNIKHLFRQ